jgi:cold shock CspA family protein
MPVRITGRVVNIIHLKGYGFVIDENGQERFLHARDFVRSNDFVQTSIGDSLTFVPTRRDRGGRNGLACQEVERVF